MVPFIVIGAIVLLLFLIIISNISVVQQSRAYVIERLGAFHRVWGVGLHFKAPFIDRIAKKVSLKACLNMHAAITIALLWILRLAEPLPNPFR